MNKDEEAAIEKAVDTIEQTEKSHADTVDDELTGLTSTVEKDEKAHHTRTRIVGVVIFILLLTTLLVVPFTRYGLLGLVITKPVTLKIVDAASGRPVSTAKVSIGRIDVETDAKGIAKIESIAVGEHQLRVEKKNYTTIDTTHIVPVVFPEKDTTIPLVALGRTATFTMKNLLTNAPIREATVEVEGASALSDEHGKASVVLPVKSEAQTGSVKADGFNTAEVSITMKAGEDPELQVLLVPHGKVYFLSKRTGKIDVMSANLDGSAATVIIPATGKESDNETSLLASPSWAHLMLIARRDNTWPKLHTVSTTTGKLTLVDDTEASYEPIGWVGAKFYYKITKYKQAAWQNGTEAVVSYNAETGQRNVVDSTVGIGTSYYDMAAQHISQAFIADGKVIYVKSWQYSQSYAEPNRPTNIMAIIADGDLKTTLKDLPATGDTYADASLQKPGTIVFRLGKNDASREYYRYLEGKVTKIDTDDTAFYNNRFSYLMSPNSEKALWTEQRDGLSVVFVAKRDLTGGNQISTGEYGAFGWVGNDYVLYSKNQSELYIAPTGALFDGAHKISNYHKGNVYMGYGWGYGGTAT